MKIMEKTRKNNNFFQFFVNFYFEEDFRRNLFDICGKIPILDVVFMRLLKRLKIASRRHQQNIRTRKMMFWK